MAGVVATVLSVISLGLPAVIAWITERLGPAIPIWKAFAMTAPLTLAVALIGVGLVRGWIDGVFPFVFSVAGALAATAGLGHLLGLGGWVDLAAVWRDLPSGVLDLPIAVALLFLQNYWKLYGPQQFASSLVVGAFLAWAWGAKILPHVDALRLSAQQKRAAAADETKSNESKPATQRAA